MPYGPAPTPRGKRPPKESRAKEPRAQGSRAEEPHAKPVQVTVDLPPAEYEVLNLWLARASLELDQPVARMTLSRGIRAMIQAAAADHVVSDAVLDVMRKEQP
ncbi:MAG TPA: hypothetical protein VN847_08875 [Streptosporangiaceae bacterium]|nr:hypothetical protein [Streptosporangiaceae bacterium]